MPCLQGTFRKQQSRYDLLSKKRNVILNIPKKEPALWNSLPASLRAENSLSNFKSVLKTHLLKLGYKQQV